MQRRNLFASVASAIAISLLASCSAEPAPTVEKMPPSPPPTKAGTASGHGTVKMDIWSKDPSKPPRTETIDFTPAFAYAYPARVGGQQTTWIVVADQALDSAALDAADDREGLLERACDDKHMRYTALELDGKGVPMASQVCPGDGRVNSAELSPGDTLGDRGSVHLEVNDGKHIRGSMAIGVGSTRLGDVESFGETTGEYQFDVDLSPPTLRDRVLAEGDEQASGLPGAKAALVKYFAAAGESKSLADITMWLTPESRALSEAKFADAQELAPDFAARMYQEFAKSHSHAPNIISARAIGAAAVVTSEMHTGSLTMTCETLLLQMDAVWKIGKEICRSPGHN